MILAFELSMPTAPSWNGKWSGEGRCYVKLETFRGVKAGVRAAQILDGAPYRHHWEDGWCAEISVREVTPDEARKLRQRSVGFAGYDWMVETLRLYGRIMDNVQLDQYLKTQREAEAAAFLGAGI